MHGPLTKADLFPDGPLQRLGRRVDTFADLDSTNARLLSNAAAFPDGAVAHAEFQTGGRGRQGRSWLAPRGSSILLSILLVEPDDSPLITHAAMLAALSAAEAIEEQTSCCAALRWPNDLVVAGRKLGGVLAETTPLPGDSRKRRALVVGVGLNCLQQRGHFAGELADTATSLEIECTEPISRLALAAALLRRLDSAFDQSNRRDADWSRLRTQWTARCEELGARVRLVENAREFTGVILDVTDDGELLVQLDRGGRRCFDPATTTRIA